MLRAVRNAARQLEQCHALQQVQLDVRTCLSAVSALRGGSEGQCAVSADDLSTRSNEHGAAQLSQSFPHQVDSSTALRRGAVRPCGLRASAAGRCTAVADHPSSPPHLRALLTNSTRARGWSLQLPYFQQVRFASPAAAKSKAKGRGGGDSRKAAEAPVAPRIRTPEWARMPLFLDAIQRSMRRRTSRLLTLSKQLQAEAVQAESGGWAAASKVAAAQEAARALPIPPIDSGEVELNTATASGTTFEMAHGVMKELCRRGVCLDAERHLLPLLRKASTAEHLALVLELLRTNHLVQAAARLGAHEAAHSTLHGVLVQECQRLRTAEPLAKLWDSLYEYGMEPSREAAEAAVQAAVSQRDGPAAAALLALTSQYTEEPLVAQTDAMAVMELLGTGNPEEAAKLRGLLTQLGFKGVA